MRVTNRTERYISYRLNILGIRVWEDRCHLVARDRTGHWQPLGSAKRLPIALPHSPEDIGGDTLLLTAYQYDLEQPGSDLRAVLSKKKDFQQALLDDSRGRPRDGTATPVV